MVTRCARRALLKPTGWTLSGSFASWPAKFAGDPGACRTVVVPSVEEEDAKRPHPGAGIPGAGARPHREDRVAALCSPPRAFGRGRLSVPGTPTCEGSENGRRPPAATISSHELNRLRRRLSLTLEMIRELDAVREQALEAQRTTPASRTVKALLHDPRDRRELRLRPDEGGVLPDLRQRAANRQLSGSCPSTPFQSGGMDRDRRINRAGKQPASPQNARPTRLALASLPTRDAAMRHGSRPCWLASRGRDPPHHNRPPWRASS